MDLDEAQRKKVAEWIAQGLRLSDIQNHLASELGVSMTYMDVRLLVDDLKLTPIDIERPKPAQSLLSGPTPSPAGAQPAAPQGATVAGKTAAPGLAGEAVSISVDQLARPGAVVSGKVTFSDGNKADWYFDQAGRLGLLPKQAGYRPPAEDLQEFQMLLETELSRMGL